MPSSSRSPFAELESAASLIDPVLLEAYRETRYHVQVSPAFTLCIDEPSAQLLALQGRHGADSSAFLTACNPRSERIADVANAFRQAALLSEITRRGLPWFPGLGQHPTNGWEGEPSFLVLGLTRDAAGALGRRFGQNAILWSAADGVPRLVALR